jgi:arabinosaccharide transport system permease protein
MNRLKQLLFSQKIAPYVFTLPFIAVFTIFFIYPMISTIVMSFQSILPGETTFIGLKNYSKILQDKIFYIALRNSFLYMVLTCLLLIPFPMLFASFLNSKLMIGSGIFKAIFFVPVLTSVVVAGTIFRMMFGELPGSLMNGFISYFGLAPIKWLKNFSSGFFVLILLACWRWTGVNIMYFLAGLKNIPEELYESADIDGANSLKQMLYITIPMLKPTFIYVFTISIYAGLRMFTESYMLWGGNNSPQNNGLTIVGYLYRQGIEQYNFGYASTVGLILLLLALALNMSQLKFAGMFKRK